MSSFIVNYKLAVTYNKPSSVRIIVQLQSCTPAQQYSKIVSIFGQVMPHDQHSKKVSNTV